MRTRFATALAIAAALLLVHGGHVRAAQHGPDGHGDRHHTRRADDGAGRGNQPAIPDSFHVLVFGMQ